MRSNLQFDFTVDKAAKTIYITREFNASLNLVWDAFTKAELLDQWVAPAPMVAKTKYMNFEVGGKRFWAMISPDGKESWILEEFKSITPKTNFKRYNAFADKDENPQLPGSEWDFNFNEQNGITKVSITIFNESFERMDREIESGFQKGYTSTLSKLEKLLSTLKNK